MKPRCGCQSSGKLIKVLLALGLAVIMLGTVWSFTWAAQASGGSPTSAREGREVLDAASVGFTLTAKAEAPDGSVYDVSNSGDIVYNGDVLTYAISLCNENATAITGVLIDDVLPENTLDNRTIACSDDCDLIGEGEYVPVPSGVTIWITITRQTRWTFASIGPGECVDMAVWGRVIGQSAGTWFGNTASTNVGGLDRYLSSEVGERPPDAGVGLPEFPSWLSDDFGGTIDQDWGDFDRDGDLDLVLGSSLGATVYRNEGGDLEAYWQAPYYTSEDDPRHAYGVRWADLDGDPEQRLELVVVGNSVDHALEGEGVNYIYAYNEAGEEFVQTNVFTSSLQLVRVAPADYDGDGDIDLIASANAINAPCAVRLYRNDGTGNFIGETDQNVDGNVWYPCVSDAGGEDATAALGPVDYDNDGDIDLAIGAFPSTLRLLINRRQSRVLTDTNPFMSTVVLETDLEYIPYGLAWGDYDLDGYLDLAAAYPLQRKVYVYHNEMDDLGQRVLAHAYTLRTVSFMEPLSVDWGDFDGDGWLDLAVADSRLAIYVYDQTDDGFVRADYLGRPASGGQVWSVRAIDLENRGNLALVATNRDGFSRLFDARSSKLKSTMQQVEVDQVESVAWGDWNGDGSVDLLFGSGSGESGARLYLNDEGAFPLHESLFAGFGPHAIAFGDITGDGELEIIVGKGSGLHIYDNDVPIGSPPVLFVPGDAISSVALGDFDDNEVLDVLVGRENGTVDLYLLSSSGGILSVLSISPIVAAEGPSVSDLAVGDYDGDNYLDFAAGFDGGGAHVYRNFGNFTFDLVWHSAVTLTTRAVAWADYDGDNDPDLAVGNYGTDDYVWRNNGGAFSTAPIWTSTTTMTLTTSLAWGDWNNDGYPDLAVGKDGAPDVVYANLGSGDDYLALVQMWRSDESYATTDVAWGDRDGDGDLDLAVSQDGDGASGFYENTLAVPAHIAASEAEAGKLPAAPPYVYVDRPGDTCDAYLYSSSEILGNPGLTPPHVVTITYRLYDLQGDPVVSTDFEYSLDGEVWLPATPYPSSPPPITATNGVPGVFVWNAFADEAVGEYARFRVRVVTQEAIGPVQRAVGVGVSPPFRVRAKNCTWPEASLTATELSSPDPEQKCYRFTVAYTANGTAYFDWDMDGDGIYEVIGTPSPYRDQCYTNPVPITSPAVRLRTPQCPGRPAFDRVTIGSPWDHFVYMPLVLNRAGVVIPGDAKVSSVPASSAGKASGRSVAGATGGTAVDPGVADYSTVQGGVGTTSKVTMFALGVNSQPAINSDGSRIAFWSTGEWTGQNSDGSIEIFVAEPGEFGRVTYAQVTSSTGSVLGGFSLSPSMDDAGDRIVFFSDMDNGENGDRNFEIFMADITEVSSKGVSVTQVTHTPRGVSILPDISGDGTYIAFASDNDLTGDSVDQFPWGQLEIYRAEVVGEVVTFQRVTTSTEEFAINDKPSISEDGRFIAFVSNQDVTGQHTNDDGNLEVFMAEIGPSGQVIYTQITNSAACVNDDPSINADGTHIAYLSDCIGGGYDIYLWRDGLGIIQITETEGDEDHPSISADGSRVAYISGPTSERKLYLYDVIEQKVIGPSPAEPGGNGFNAYPVLSSDGASVAFNHNWDIYVKHYPLADLALSKTVSISQTVVGEVFTYTLSITNVGPSPAPGVVLTDVLPAGVEPAQSYAGERWNDADLIIELHLDEEGGTVFTDTSNHDNNATCPGENCPTTVPGKVNAALLFNTPNPPDDYIKINHVNDSPNTEITVMFWVSGTQLATDNTPFSYAAPGYPNEFRIANLTDTGLRVWVGGTAKYLNISDPEIELMDGEWHHVAVTWYRSDDRIQLYVDGEWQDTEDIRVWHCWGWWWWHWCGYIPRGYTLHGGGSLLLGQNHVFGGTPDHPFSGSLDEVAVYRRVLSADEIHNAFMTQGGEADPNTYSSPVMARPEGAAGWSTVRWMPSRPVGVDLPDYGGTDNEGYPEGRVDMSGNVLLMHLNEPAGYQGFLDTSSEGNDGYCEDVYQNGEGFSCPTVGVAGKLGNALQFDSQDDYVIVKSIESFPDTEISAAFWIKSNDGDQASIISYAVPGQYNEFLLIYSPTIGLQVHIGGAASTSNSIVINDAKWHHVVVTWQSSNGDLRIYVDGEQRHSQVLHSGHEIVGDGTLVLGQDQDKIGGLFEDSQAFQGTLDEVAIFDRVLISDEVRDIYLRGALKVEFEVRACDDPLCSGETFIGSYPDHTDPTIFPPAFAIDVPDMPFFQYRVTSTSASSYSPGLQWVKVYPWVQCSSGSPITCTIGTEIAPLPVYSSTSVVLPVVVPKTAAFTSSVAVLTNTATVDSLVVSDHTPDNDVARATSSLNSSCWVRVGDTYYVDLQSAVDAAPVGATLRVAGTCGGVERRGGTVQTLYLTKTVTIQGGYTATNNLAGPPDPATYTTTLHAGDQGGVVVISGDASPTLEGLHITGGAPITDSVGGGIRIVTATVTISGCRVYSNTAVERGGGIYLASGGAVLFNNVIQSNTAGQYGGGVYVIGSHLAMTNTVLATNQAGGDQGGRGGGVYVAGMQTQVSMLHTTIVGNAVVGATIESGDGVYIANGSVVLTNTIVADHDADELYSVGIYQAGGFVSLEAVLWWNNTLDYDVFDDPSRDYEDDPLFVDAAAGNYHIQAGSGAVDRAVESGVLSDLDGHPRGIEPDLGAYESPYGIAVAKIANRGIVEPGEALTYTIYVTNTGYLPLTGLVLTDTLPAPVTAVSPTAASNVLTWTLGSLPAGETWSPPPVVVVNVSSVYTGVLTNTVTVSASELVIASADVQVTVSAENGDLPWVEDFDLPDLTTYDAGPTAWSIDDSDLGSKAIFYVQNGRFKSSRTEGEGVWISGPIDVHDTPEVDVSIKLLGTGSLEAGGRQGDYVRVYYKLDGGPEVRIIEREGPFNGGVWEEVEVRGIETGGAETIQIIVRTRTTGKEEFYYWDNVTVALLPEIDVGGNGHSIPDGDITPSTDDDTDFGSVRVGNPVTHTFTITNTGIGDLNLTGIPRVQVVGAPSEVFTVTQQPSTPVMASGGTTTFTITFDPAGATTYTATVSIANNDTNENPYTFVIRGTGVAPEIDVGGNGVSIPDGDTTPETGDDTDFGNVLVVGGVVTHTFTITNTGSGDLNLTGIPRVQVAGAPAGVFTVAQQPGTPVAAFGGTTTFAIKFDPASATTYTATVSIANDDSDENPYTFVIGGTGTVPEIDVGGNGVSIPDGDTTPEADDGTDFGNVLVVGGVVTHTFTITNTGSGNLNLTGTPRVQVLGPQAAAFPVTQQPGTSTVVPGGTTTFVIAFDPASAIPYTATVRIANNDSDENPYNFVIGGTGTVPEIDVGGAGGPIADGDIDPVGDAGADFGSVIVTGTNSATHTFTITNTGSGNLNLIGASPVQIDPPGVFTVMQQPGTSTVVPGGTTTFVIAFDPASATTYTATVYIANNDWDENPYDFVIQGTGTELDMGMEGAGGLIVDGDIDPVGDAGADFGSIIVTGTNSVTYTFIITSAGNGELNLIGVPPSTDYRRSRWESLW